MSSGFRFVVTKRDNTRFKAYLLAIAVQLIAVPLLFVAGLSKLTSPSTFPVGAIIGGLIFGLSMSWAGGCAAGVWYKTGAGSVSAAVAIFGMALGAALLETGPLAGLRSDTQSVGAAAPDLAAALGAPLWMIAVPIGAIMMLVLLRTSVTTSGAWSWRRTGLVVGAIATVAWPLSSAAQRHFGMAVVPGTVAMLTATTGANVASLGWDMLFVIGLPVGAFIAARRSGAVRLSAGDPPTLIKRFIGGLGLGCGASLAAGCTVGHGLTGVPLLTPGSILTIVAIFAGSALTGWWEQRRANG